MDGCSNRVNLQSKNTPLEPIIYYSDNPPLGPMENSWTWTNILTVCKFTKKNAF